MNNLSSDSINKNTEQGQRKYQGIYGIYEINKKDEHEVRLYRISLLCCGLSFNFGLSQWILLGPNYAWIWIIPLSISTFFALNWIHIYLRSIHNILKIFCLLGSIGALIILNVINPQNLLIEMSNKPIYLLPITPLFAALTGLGFKEYFCFKQVEAIGITILLPLSLILHLLNLFNHLLSISLIYLSSILLIILALKKFGTNPANDIGDKSIFDFLENERASSKA